MKKIIAIALAIVLIASMGAGVVMASGNSSNGVPSAKTSVGYSTEQVTTTSGEWLDLPGLDNIVIKTSNSSSLEISFTAEADLITDVQLKGTNGSSTSWAGVYVRALIDGKTIPEYTGISDLPSQVALNYRLMRLTGTLWGTSTSTTFTGLPDQYIDIYEQTKSANGFNWYVPDVGVGVHTITIQALIDTGSEGIAANEDAGLILGSRTCFVEADRLN